MLVGMKTIALVGALLLFGQRPPQLLPIAQQQPAHFEFTLERTASGFAAQCSVGCEWERVAIACPADCRILLDASGVSYAAVPREVRGFVILLQPTDAGWQARSYGETAWRTLGWGCESRWCRARVDERGVAGR
jgi:hypothetical protein